MKPDTEAKAQSSGRPARNALPELLRDLEGANPTDAGGALDSVLELLENTHPEALDPVFALHTQDGVRRCLEGAKRLFFEHRDGVGIEGDQHHICYAFFCLIALLRSDVDSLTSPPSFVKRVDEFPSGPMTTAVDHIARQPTELEKYIERLLIMLGHVHRETSREGMLEEQTSETAYKVLSTQWRGNPHVREWLVQYLSFRFIRMLMRIDIFYALYSRLPHYNELKILSYLLQLLGRDEYLAIGRFTELSHTLYSELERNCRAILNESQLAETVRSVVRDSIEKTMKGTQEAVDLAIRTASGASQVDDLTLRITAQFFQSYMRELSEAGQLHTVLWSVSMFEEVKDAFRSVALLGGRGSNILIIGETGTGKEAIAKLFLKTSGELYVALNCAGLSWDAICSDLFQTAEDSKDQTRGKPNSRTIKKDVKEMSDQTGEEISDQTGEEISDQTGEERSLAMQPLVGRVDAVLLDELDRAKLDCQGGLLRFLDRPYGEYRRPGHVTPIRWGGLAVATATEGIYKAMQSGSFLSDLFWRFDIRARIEPLRAVLRDEDKSSEFKNLLQFVLDASRAKLESRSSISRRLRVGAIELTEVQFKRLRDYDWPGNLRELLEFADSLVIAIAKAQSISDKITVGGTVPDQIFNKVFDRFSYFGRMVRVRNENHQESDDTRELGSSDGSCDDS